MSSSDAMLSELRARLGDRYAIERQLGRGGMGAVYLARDLQLDRPLALKVLPAEFASQADLRARFLQETRTAASFSHPNIVPVFAVEDRDGLLAFAMGYVEGESVAELVKRAGPLSVRDAVRLMQDVGYALAYAHGRGVVHRDIKPDNIMIERATGRALVMDFGISRAISTSSMAPGLTRVGEVVGTPEFMSPEQASGDTIDGRSDLYSLGLVAWFALTGRLAISGENTQKVLVKQLTEAVPPIGRERADLPTALSDVIDRCVRKDPDERFARAEEVVEALDLSSLRGVDVPLPIRLLADEVRQASLILLASVVITPILYVVLRATVEYDLDAIPPVVLFVAVIWGRMAQMLQQARRLALRGFTVSAIHAGFSAIANEREADRVQLRADPLAVAKRRRQVLSWFGLFAASFALRYWVLLRMRTEISPGIYSVSVPGVIILYAAYVMRGLSIVGLLRSPLRRPPGEWLFRWFWIGRPGRVILRATARGIARPDSAASTAGVAPSPIVPSPIVAQPSAATPASLEQRVAALERWRDSQS